MLFNLVRPVKRSGSTKHQFVKRIPNDLRKRMVGRKLPIPIGDDTAFVTITAAMDSRGSSTASLVGHCVVPSRDDHLRCHSKKGGRGNP